MFEREKALFIDLTGHEKKRFQKCFTFASLQHVKLSKGNNVFFHQVIESCGHTQSLPTASGQNDLALFCNREESKPLFGWFSFDTDTDKTFNPHFHSHKSHA